MVVSIFNKNVNGTGRLLKLNFCINFTSLIMRHLVLADTVDQGFSSRALSPPWGQQSSSL